MDINETHKTDSHHLIIKDLVDSVLPWLLHTIIY